VAGLAYGGDGRIWAGVGSRLLALDEEGHPQFSVALGSAPIRRIYASRDGAIWAATQDGVLRTDVRRRQAERMLLADGTPVRGYMDAFAEDGAGVLWTGGIAGSGLLRYDPACNRMVTAAVLLDGAPATPDVKGLLFDEQGRFWMDTSSGLYVLRSQTDGRMAFAAMDTGPLLRGRAFGANLLADRDGRVWSQRGFIDPATRRNYMFHTADGVDMGVGWFRA
jgi:ligand-binding sensor domain-containing protein